MKYVIQALPDDTYTPEERRMQGWAPELDTEEQAIKQAANLSRGKNISVGIFKIIKQVDPPNVNVKDVD